MTFGQITVGAKHLESFWIAAFTQPIADTHRSLALPSVDSTVVIHMIYLQKLAVSLSATNTFCASVLRKNNVSEMPPFLAGGVTACLAAKAASFRRLFTALSAYTICLSV